MMTKFIIAVLVFMSTLSYPRALTVSGLYGDVGATTSYAENLIMYALSHDNNFLEKDYVIYRSEQYVYQIVWGELNYNNDTVTGENVQYATYSRNNSTNYEYSYGTDESFNLSNINYLVTSNISTLGVMSSTFLGLEHEKDQRNMMIMCTSALLAILILKLRKE